MIRFTAMPIEMAGIQIVMPVASAACWGSGPTCALFQLFDAREPWPIREVDHGMRGGRELCSTTKWQSRWPPPRRS
jgi:hypothetical protein